MDIAERGSMDIDLTFSERAWHVECYLDFICRTAVDSLFCNRMCMFALAFVFDAVLLAVVIYYVLLLALTVRMMCFILLLPAVCHM